MVSFGKTGGSSQQNYVWQPQTSYLEGLYETGTDLYNQLSPGIRDFSTGFSSSNMPTLQDSIASTGNTDFLGNIKSGVNLGMSGLSGMINPTTNPYLESTIGDMWNNLGRNVSEVVLPGQRSEESITGNYGGSRGALAEGMALQEAIRSGLQGERTMRSGAYESGMGRALSASDLYTRLGLTADQAELARTTATPDMISSAYNLGMSPYNAPFNMLSNYQNIIGAPTILGQGSTGSGFNVGIG